MAHCKQTKAEYRAGVSPTYPDYLERQESAGILDLEMRGDKFAIRLHDPARHAEVAAKLRKLMS